MLRFQISTRSPSLLSTTTRHSEHHPLCLHTLSFISRKNPLSYFLFGVEFMKCILRSQMTWTNDESIERNSYPKKVRARLYRVVSTKLWREFLVCLWLCLCLHVLWICLCLVKFHQTILLSTIITHWADT